MCLIDWLFDWLFVWWFVCQLLCLCLLVCLIICGVLVVIVVVCAFACLCFMCGCLYVVVCVCLYTCFVVACVVANVLFYVFIYLVVGLFECLLLYVCLISSIVRQLYHRDYTMLFTTRPPDNPQAHFEACFPTKLIRKNPATSTRGAETVWGP